MSARSLVAVAVTFGALSAACCFPSSEDMARVKAEQAARPAREEARRARVVERRGNLLAIATKVAALTEITPTPCDAARLDALRAGPPEGVADTFWTDVWAAEAGWLVAAAQAAGPDGVPKEALPPPPRFSTHVSGETLVVLRAASADARYRQGDLDNQARHAEQKPPLLAVIHERRVQDPVVEFNGVAFVPGSFRSGAYVADVTLWDLAAEELLCASRVEAVSSPEVDLGTVFRDTPGEAAQKDFEWQVHEALNAAADAMSPGMRFD